VDGRHRRHHSGGAGRPHNYTGLGGSPPPVCSLSLDRRARGPDPNPRADPERFPHAQTRALTDPHARRAYAPARTHTHPDTHTHQVPPLPARWR
jgi:hypothetical protein